MNPYTLSCLPAPAAGYSCDLCAYLQSGFNRVSGGTGSFRRYTPGCEVNTRP